MKAIWKFGPISRGETKKVMGRPVNVGIQSGNFYVWCEVDPSWRDLPNTKEADANVEWHSVRFVATGFEYEGNYIGTIHETTDGYNFVWHCIEVENV